jgi:twitching motility protein PilT
VNVYFTKGVMSASFRLIASRIKTIDELHLPTLFHSFAQIKQGLILLCGPTGEGKSSTLAAIINEINLSSAKHILTIEDPIEYMYPPAQSIISQREIGHDTHSWSIALKAALREDPDVVLIGEMRDYETVAAALTIAETGHLVFSTVHTNSSPQTIDRIIDVFPPSQQNQVRVQLSSVLKAVVSQRLVPTIDNNSRIAACEILLNNPAVSSIIREGKTHLIDNVIQTNASEGMFLLEKSLHDLALQGKINREIAQAYAIRPNEINKLFEAV